LDSGATEEEKNATPFLRTCLWRDTKHKVILF